MDNEMLLIIVTHAILIAIILLFVGCVVRIFRMHTYFGKRFKWLQTLHPEELVRLTLTGKEPAQNPGPRMPSSFMRSFINILIIKYNNYMR